MILTNAYLTIQNIEIFEQWIADKPCTYSPVQGIANRIKLVPNAGYENFINECLDKTNLPVGGFSSCARFFREDTNIGEGDGMLVRS